MTQLPVIDALLQARRSATPADALPLAASLSEPDQAYAVQVAVMAQLTGQPGVPRHWKSGGPSRDLPLTHAPLPPDGVWASPATAGDWPFHQRGIEIEIALRLGVAVDAAQAASLQPDAVDHLIDAMAVSIEVVDSRWQQASAAAPLLRLADFQSHGALVLGNWVPYVRRDWAAQTCRVTVGTQPPLQRQGSHSLGDPAWLLPQWLQRACALYGEVPAGTVVTTGTWVGIVPAQRGDAVVAVFDGIGEARVRL
ncbi:fumarylacetoacetate hydrolase family protein [Hydrogenophaga defluvii]|uniref:Fumarylacetoacetate hydrolase family protein n=1 Tax=Hydrogenophaga defluvii TaxID=249410 RepID=A0ABW2SE70_9BURK